MTAQPQPDVRQMLVTVIIPTFNHGRLLLTAVRSVLRQTLQDFEIIIIGDGVTNETRAAALKAVDLDRRIRFFDHPKDSSKGEIYRHDALIHHARGDMVCYLSDDDLWFEDHLERMRGILDKKDMAHAPALFLRPDGFAWSTPVDWEQKSWREWTLVKGQNDVGLSSGGHTMEFYRRLPHGWRTTESGYWTDHYMWMQMLAEKDAAAASTGVVTVISLPSTMRTEMSLPEREAELERLEMVMRESPEELRRQARHYISKSWLEIVSQLNGMASHHKENEMKKKALSAEKSALKKKLGEQKELSSRLKTSLKQERQRIQALPGLLRNLCRWWWSRRGQ